jgi:hypothetical protein
MTTAGEFVLPNSGQNSALVTAAQAYIANDNGPYGQYHDSSGQVGALIQLCEGDKGVNYHCSESMRQALIRLQAALQLEEDPSLGGISGFMMTGPGEEGTFGASRLSPTAAHALQIARETEGEVLPEVESTVGVSSEDLAATRASDFELSDLGDGWYRSPAGLDYGPGSVQGHRILHVMEHAWEDPSKATHGCLTLVAKGLWRLSTKHGIIEDWLLNPESRAVERRTSSPWIGR